MPSSWVAHPIFFELYMCKQAGDADGDFYFGDLAASVAKESDISESTLSQLYGFNSNTLTLLRHLVRIITKAKSILACVCRMRIADPSRLVCQSPETRCTRMLRPAGTSPGSIPR